MECAVHALPTMSCTEGLCIPRPLCHNAMNLEIGGLARIRTFDQEIICKQAKLG